MRQRGGASKVGKSTIVVFKILASPFLQIPYSYAASATHQKYYEYAFVY